MGREVFLAETREKVLLG
ncbi:hypothetical protein A2U01_0112924, partial [Trifolium medium]|nr:hypothetical protein [Trifolium medium]